MGEVRIGQRTVVLPRQRWLRQLLGWALVAGGLLGFLPVVGFWMLPLGVVVLSRDVPWLRRWRRVLTVRVLRWWRARRARADG